MTGMFPHLGYFLFLSILLIFLTPFSILSVFNRLHFFERFEKTTANVIYTFAYLVLTVTVWLLIRHFHLPVISVLGILTSAFLITSALLFLTRNKK